MSKLFLTESLLSDIIFVSLAQPDFDYQAEGSLQSNLLQWSFPSVSMTL